MKRAIALIAVLATAACGGTAGKITAEEARNAVPSQDQAKMEISQSSALASSKTSALTTGVVVSAAPFAALTIALSGAVNLGVAAPLVMVRTIVDFPPTSCEGDTCTWGPGSSWHDLNEFELTVTRVDDAYAWALSGRPKATPGAEFTVFLSGHSWPSGQRWVGHGDFTLDLDAAAAGLDRFEDSAATGKIQVTNYDNRSGQEVSVQFLGMADGDNPGHTLDAAYQYRNDATAGDLQIATRDLATGATMTLHSQWKSSGAGRGDAQMKDNPLTYDQSQCWDTAANHFALLYDSLGSGDASLCAFAQAAPTITVP